MIKLCKDCKHHVVVGRVFKKHMCGLARDHVTGELKMTCEYCRAYGYLSGTPQCGYDGDRWEPK